MINWISITERLPNSRDKQYVLTYNPIDEMIRFTNVKTMFRRNKYYPQGKAIYNGITHWADVNFPEEHK